MVRGLAKLGLAACALLVARPAGAFLVVGTDAAQGPGPETRVVVLHEGGRSIVTVAPTLRGPAKPLALVLPLPKAAAATLAAAPVTIFGRTDRLAAPRLDELWELDPCELHPNQQSSPPAASASAAPSATGSAVPSASAGTTSAVGGYQVTLLDGPDAADAAKWLSDQGYKVPDGAADALATAAKAGAVIAVARFNGAPVPLEQEAGLLPALSFTLEGSPALPLRLAGLGARGAHDVVLDVLSHGARLEAANLLNVGVPTNLDAREEAKRDVGALHRALVDYTFEKTPGAALTEYAWLASSCDGCADGAGVGADDLLALGLDRLPSAADGSQREVIVEVPRELAAAPEGPPALKPAIAACYAKVLGDMRGLAGDAKVIVQTGEGGAVKSTKIQDASAEALGRCVEEAALATRLDHANATGMISARFALVSRAYLGAVVLTRLHLRTAKGAGADVELRPAAAIEGGREEGPTGEAEKKVSFATHTNNFRPRFVVRHPWAGPIACDEPKRGVWGPKPPGRPSPGRPAASATAVATASASASGKAAAPSEAETKLAALLEELPDLAAYAIAYRAIEPPKPAATSAPSTSATPSAPAPAPSGTAPPSAGGGCGCHVAPGSPGPAAYLAISAIGALLRRRRRQIR